MGVQLEERRVTRISDVVDFPEELDSKENYEANQGHIRMVPECGSVPEQQQTGHKFDKIQVTKYHR